MPSGLSAISAQTGSSRSSGPTRMRALRTASRGCARMIADRAGEVARAPTTSRRRRRPRTACRRGPRPTRAGAGAEVACRAAITVTSGCAARTASTVPSVEALSTRTTGASCRGSVDQQVRRAGSGWRPRRSRRRRAWSGSGHGRTVPAPPGSQPAVARRRPRRVPGRRAARPGRGTARTPASPRRARRRPARTAAAVQVVRSTGQRASSAKTSPVQYEPSSSRRCCMAATCSRAASGCPAAARARASSQVSAPVTHGRSATQRAPSPGTTKRSQSAASRSRAAVAGDRAAEHRVVPVHRVARPVGEGVGPGAQRRRRGR